MCVPVLCTILDGMGWTVGDEFTDLKGLRFVVLKAHRLMRVDEAEVEPREPTRLS